MKLTINSNQLNESPATFLRRIGYTYIRDHRSGQESYVRRLTRNFYPRFHVYVFEQGGQITFNLHLDQRPTRYEGQRAHAGEYDSEVVREEFERLQNALERQTDTDTKTDDALADVLKEKPRKRWWPF